MQAERSRCITYDPSAVHELLRLPCHSLAAMEHLGLIVHRHA